MTLAQPLGWAGILGWSVLSDARGFGCFRRSNLLGLLIIGIQTEVQMPDEVARQLDAMLLGVPRSTAAHLTGLVALPKLVWEQTNDVWIAIIASSPEFCACSDREV